MTKKMRQDPRLAPTEKSIRLFRGKELVPRLVKFVLPARRDSSLLDGELFAGGVDEDQQEAQAIGGAPPWKIISFALIVIVPFLASSFYYGFIASDQYIAEARFAVRSLTDDREKTDGEGGLLDMQAATQDAYIVTNFIHSSEILKRIAPKLDYRAMFNRDGVDFWSRISGKEPNETFLRFWRKQVTTYIDGPSGIVTLEVRTFDPNDSVQLASAIISESEQLVNELTQRARNDIVSSVGLEVEKASAVYSRSLQDLNRFQQEAGLISPQSQALEKGKLLTGLIAQKLEIETRQFVVKRSSAENSPAYQQLALTRESLDAQIAALQSQLTGTESESVSKVLLRFSELETNRIVAEKLYEVARRTYEVVLAESVRKSLYVVVFVHPSIPEESLYPRRIFMPLITFIGLCVLWSTLALAWASVQDHKL